MRAHAVYECLMKVRMPFTILKHPTAFTAQHQAAVSHIPGRSCAKTVVCLAEGELILAVVPAHLRVDLELLRALAGAVELRLAREHEFAGEWLDCDLGAISPFATRRSLRVFVDHSFVGEPEMVFRAGSHTDAVSLHYWDFVELIRPTVGRIAVAA
jgi:Ala-tRNA(Pro) deacylase